MRLIFRCLRSAPFFLVCGFFFCVFLGSTLVVADTPSPAQLEVCGGGLDEGEKKLFLNIKLCLQDGWYMNGPDRLQGGHVSLDIEKQEKVRPLSLKWPRPRDKHGDGNMRSFYKKSVPLKLLFFFDEKNASFLVKGRMRLIACSEKECRPLVLPLAYRVVVQNGQVRVQDCKLSPEFCGLSWWIFLIAFLGGIVLNFMPCVLPVLGVKLMVFAKRNPSQKASVMDLWATVFGIYVAFFALACLVVVLNFLGANVGWGMHFQNPYFLSTMTACLALFLANVWELFEIPMPSMIQRLSGRLMHAPRAFFTGVFSVVLATPCTAPFVGTAVGFALTRHALDVFLIFSFLAFGFASPYWIAALIPSHRLRLPSPGPWLAWLHRLVSFFLGGTLLWFLWLLTQMFTWSYMVSVGMVLVLLFLNLRWFLFFKPFVTLGLFVLLILAPLWQPFVSQKHSIAHAEPEKSQTLWQAFQPEQIARHVEMGKTVFVDVTADWCVTCQVNKRMVLDKKSMGNLLKDERVVCMRADWTESSSLITTFLKRFNKAGIPFNVVFGPGFPKGLVLSELLTEKGIRQALQRVRG